MEFTSRPYVKQARRQLDESLRELCLLGKIDSYSIDMGLHDLTVEVTHPEGDIDSYTFNLEKGSTKTPAPDVVALALFRLVELDIEKRAAA